MTSLSDPPDVEEGVTHDGVANMPALAARSTTLALAGATLRYVRLLAAIGIDATLATDAGLRQGLQIRNGAVTPPGLAADSDLAHGGA
jgi:alanine dehydrogenase